MITEEYNLNEIAASIIEAQKIETYKAEVVYDKHAKNQAKYTMGELLLNARTMLPKDEDFGKWVAQNVNTPLKELEEKPLAKNTPANYMALPRFGTIDDCLMVGFSNVYKIIQKGDQATIDLLHGVLNCDEITIDGEQFQPCSEDEQKELIKKILGKTSAKKLYTEAQQAFAVDMAKAAVYSEILGIDATEDDAPVTEADVKPLAFDPEKIKNVGIDFINAFKAKYM